MEINKSDIMHIEKINIIKKDRQSEFELLRIIEMFFIIAHHIAHFMPMVEYSQTEYMIRRFFLQNGKLGVNLFVLITAYFMINKKLTLHHIIKILLPVWFYSILLYFFYSFISN